MKIIYLHQYFKTPDMSGGTRSFDFATQLVKAGHEVHMITSDTEADGWQWRAEQISGITVHWLPVRYSNKQGFIARVIAFFKFAALAGFRAIKVGGDVIFASSTPLTISIPGVVAKTRLKIPLVFEVRDLWPTIPIAMGVIKSKILIKLTQWLELWSYKHSEHIVCLSEGMRDGVVSTDYPDHQTTVIPNISNLDKFTVETPSTFYREKLGLKEDTRLVLYVGTLGVVNGVGYMVNLAEKVKHLSPNIHFLIVGDGIEREAILNQAKDLGVLDNNLSYLEPIAKSQVPALLSEASLCTSFVIPVPELNHNSANKFFDTLAAAKPIAINHAGWQKDLIEEKQLGLYLDQTNLDQAAKDLVSFCESSERIEAAGESGLALARDAFDRIKLAARLENILLDVVEKH